MSTPPKYEATLFTLSIAVAKDVKVVLILSTEKYSEV